MKCKRNGCDNEALVYPSYADCCSLYCRDINELETECQKLYDAGVLLDSALQACVFSFQEQMSERGLDECAKAKREWQTVLDEAVYNWEASDD